MELEYGAGYPAALLDLTSQRVVVYNSDSAADVHERFGGKQYYTSRSGLSGKGHIPNSLTARPCAVLRTDEARPRVPRRVETLPGYQVIVPTRHLDREENAPLIVVKSTSGNNHDVFFVSDEHLMLCLSGKLETRRSQRIELTSWVTVPGNGQALFPDSVYVTLHSSNSARFGLHSVRRVLELLFWGQLYDRSISITSNPWKWGLGLATAGEDTKVFHTAGGLLRRPAELTLESLTKACPWVHFVNDDLAYIYEDRERNSFVLMERDGTSIPLSLDEIVMAMNGSLSHMSDVNARLDEERELNAQVHETEPNGEELPEWERELLGLEKDSNAGSTAASHS